MKVLGVIRYLMKRLTLNWQLRVRGGAVILSILIILEVWLLGILGEIMRTKVVLFCCFLDKNITIFCWLTRKQCENAES